MNQQVDNAIGGFNAARITVPLNGGTTQYAEASALVETYQTSRDGLGDSCEHGNQRLSGEEYAMLLRPNAEPRPGAERRVYPIENHGKDKPFNHADRRRAE